MNQHSYDTQYYDSQEWWTRYRLEMSIKIFPKPNRLLKMLQICENDLILDLGSSCGYYTIMSGKHKSNVIAVDPSLMAIKCSRKLSKVYNVENFINFSIAIGQNLPFKDKCFSKIVVADLIEHLTEIDVKKILRECFRVLKNGGRLVLHTSPSLYNSFLNWRWWAIRVWELGRGKKYHTHIQLFSVKRLTKLLQEIGFKFKVWTDHCAFGKHHWKYHFKSLERNKWLKYFLGRSIYALGKKC